MASQSSIIGLLRVLLSANAAEYESGMKKSVSVTKGVTTELKGTAAEAQKTGQAIAKGLALPPGADRIPGSIHSISDSFKKLAGETLDAGRISADFGTIFKATIAGFVSAEAIIGGVKAAWGALTDFVSSSVQAYSAQESAVKKMTAALTAQGNATPQVIKQYKDMASQFQQTTVFSDELINEMQALLVQVGDVMPAEMEGALQAATNLASGLGIDLRAATMLVGKAFEGETGTLKRYGIVIDDTKLKAQGITAVLDAVQSRFGGQAQAEAETYAGKLKQIANAWSEVQEIVGEIVVSNPIVEASLRDVMTALQGGTGAVIEHQHSWSNLLAMWGQQGGPAFIAMSAFVRRLEDAADAANKAAKAAQFSPEFIKPAASHVPQALQDAQRLRDETKRLAEEQKKAAEAAEAWAKAIASVRAQISGADLQRDVKQLAEAYVGLTREQRANEFVIDRVAEAAQKLFDNHAVLTPQLFRMIIANGNLAASMPPVVAGMQAIGDAGRLVSDHFQKTVEIADSLIPKLKVIAGLGSEFRGVGAIPVPIAPELEKSIDGVQELIGALQTLSQVGPASISAVVSSIGQMIQGWQMATDAVKNFQKGGLGLLGGLANGINLVNGLLGIAQSLMSLGEKFFGDRGRDMVESFAASHGGFDRLHEKLLELGAEGEKLWIKLTQGVGRNNPLEAQAAIALVAEALARGAQKTVEATKDIDEAAKKLAASLRAEFDSLTSEIDSLTQSIANEMPEEVMGIVEQQTRERIRQIEEERKKIEEELRQVGEAVGEEAEGVGETIGEHIGGAIEDIRLGLHDNASEWENWARRVAEAVKGIVVDVEIPEPDPGRWGSFSSGTAGLDFQDFGARSVAMLHSREAVIPQTRVGSFAGQVATALQSTSTTVQSSRGGSRISLVINNPVMDTAERTRQLARDIAREIDRGGDIRTEWQDQVRSMAGGR